MGILSNLFSVPQKLKDPYPDAIPLTADKEKVTEMFLKYLDLAYQDDPNYGNFNIIMKSPKGISLMKTWFTKFTEEELIGHNFAVWLQDCTKICFEPKNSKHLTDNGIIALCKEVQKLL